MVGLTREAFGGVDVLVNNAGFGVAGDVVETSEADLDRILDVNVKGVFFSCQEAIPVMLEAGGGIIVNVTSVGRARGRRAPGGLHGVEGGRPRADPVGRRGLHAPRDPLQLRGAGHRGLPWVGRILTGQPDPVAARQAMVDRQPLGRLGRPEEIAAAIVYLASPLAAFVNGTCLSVDGGFTAR